MSAVLKIIEDNDKIWAIGLPVNQAVEIMPDVEWRSDAGSLVTEPAVPVRSARSHRPGCRRQKRLRPGR